MFSNVIVFLLPLMFLISITFSFRTPLQFREQKKVIKQLFLMDEENPATDGSSVPLLDSFNNRDSSSLMSADVSDYGIMTSLAQVCFVQGSVKGQ
jgi:hypothetical protein